MWSPTDEALLAGVASGDDGAVATLVRRYQRRVYGLAFVMLNDASAAEDVAQDAFVRMWRHAAAYDERRGPVATWLLTITRNLAIDALRVRRAEPVDPDTLLSLEEPPTGSPADEAVLRADALRTVRLALTRLPAEQRRAVLRAAYLGQTAREVGVDEGVPLGTAKTRIRTGLIALRAAVEAREEA